MIQFDSFMQVEGVPIYQQIIRYVKQGIAAGTIRDREELPFRLCRRVWGVPEFCWTLRSPRELKAAEQAGACGIFEGFTPRENKRGEEI